MPREERRKLLESLEPAERQRLFAAMRARRQAEQAANRTDPGRPRPAFVFQRGPEGALAVKPVLIGLGNWDYTEVIAGLEPGEEVLEVPLSLVQQQELADRIRSRSGVPGVRRE